MKNILYLGHRRTGKTLWINRLRAEHPAPISVLISTHNDCTDEYHVPEEFRYMNIARD